jgi:hypothetical protein
MLEIGWWIGWCAAGRMLKRVQPTHDRLILVTTAQIGRVIDTYDRPALLLMWATAPHDSRTSSSAESTCSLGSC